MSPFDAQTQYYDRAFKGLAGPHAVISAREFAGCTFKRCSFPEAVFKDCKFRGCVFEECDLSLASLEGSGFSDTRFQASRLIGLNWIDTTWAKGRPLLPVSFLDCTLNHSMFIGLDLREMVITRCIAREVDFEDADLTRANCTYTDFLNSRFVHTNLTGADFTGATNYAISATLNTLKQTKFSLPEAISLLHHLDIILGDSEEGQTLG